MKLKKIITISFILSSITLLTGCDDLIEKKIDNPSIHSYKVDELEDDKYYVKEGTSFHQVYDCEKTFGSSDYSEANSERMIWNRKKSDKYIPTLYKGECIVYNSSKETIDDLQVERFKDLGWSIGVKGLEENSNGIFEIHTDKNYVKENSSIEKSLNIFGEENNSSSKLAISEIAGTQLTEKNITRSGTITGLLKNKTYTCGAYIGSNYKSIQVKADTHFYQSSEVLDFSDIEITKRGYIAIDMPDNLKTGYYYIGNQGMFRYVDVFRGDNISKLDYNEPNEDVIAKTLDDTVDMSEHIEKFGINEWYSQVDISIRFDLNEAYISRAILINPNNEASTFKQSSDNEFTFTINIKELLKGEYTIKIYGINNDRINLDVRKGSALTDEQRDRELNPEKYTFGNDTNNTDNNNNNNSNKGSNKPKKSNKSNSDSGQTQSSQPKYIEVPENEPLTEPIFIK